MNAKSDYAGARYVPKTTLATYVIGVLIYCSLGAPSETLLRYLIYLAPLLLWCVVLAGQRGSEVKGEKVFAIVLIVYFVVCLVSLLFSLSLDFRWLSNFIFISSPVAVMLLGFSFTDKHCKILAAFFIIIFIEGLVLNGAVLHFDLLSSSGGLESGIAFPCGALLIYFLHKRDYVWSFVFLFVVILSFKRIVFLGVFLAVAFYYFITLFNLKKKWVSFLTIAIVISLFFVASNVVFFSEYLIEWFGLDMSVNQLTMGRSSMSSDLDQYLSGRGFVKSLIGDGPGTTDYLAGLYSDGRLSLIHNDYKKLLTDYGYLGGGSILVALYYAYKQSLFGCIIFSYVSILFITDNVLIYSYCSLVFYILVSAERRESIRNRGGRL